MKKLILALTCLFLAIPYMARRMRKIIIISLIFTFIQASISYATEPNLVGWWKFDEGQGNIAYDSAGSNNGTLQGNPQWVNGRIGSYALAFDGNGDYVGTPLVMSLAHAWTVSIWLKSNEMTPRAPYNLGDSYSGGKIKIESRNDYDYGGFRFRYAASGTGSVITTGVVNEGNWHHIVWYQRGGAANSLWGLYIDGVLINETIVPVAKNANISFTIGREGSGSDYNGTIDDVRIYNRALSAEEIWQLYWQGFSKAFNPYPANGAAGVNPNVVLSWSPAKYALSHDVYLGLYYNDVNNATPDSNKYMGNFDVNSYDPNGLNIGVTYYWRIDEVNGPNVWKGTVWSFMTGPAIGLSAEEFVFDANENGSNPPDQILTIRNSGVGILNWEIVEDCNWLTVNPVSGSSTGEPNEVTLSVDITGLVAGVYVCNLTIFDPNAANSPRPIGVNLVVHGPIIELNAHTFEFVAIEGGANPQQEMLTIRNVGGGILNWSIAYDCNWLTVNPVSGSSIGEPNEVTLSVDITGLATGIYNCNLTISDPNAENNPQIVAVILYVAHILHVPSEYHTIQEAISAANDGDIVIVADGVYTDPGNHNLDYGGKTITVKSANGPENCIIYCQSDGRGFFFHSRETSNSVLDGFTITDGRVFDCGDPETGGAGICINNSSPTISNCIVTENFTELIPGCLGYCFGGGINIRGNSRPIFKNCIISNNFAGAYGMGGGVYDEAGATFFNCTISRNVIGPDFGCGGIACSRGTIINCIIWGNYNGQICGYLPVVAFSDIGGGYTGVGNIDADPRFVDAYYYHLKSQAGHWNPDNQTWVRDAVTSPCIDAGDPNSDWSKEPCPNGGRINMGAYGGTNQASKSLGCFPINHPDYDEWVNVGCPPCWCYPRQCHGDTDNTSEYIKGKGYYYVHFRDMPLVPSAWNVREPPQGPGIKWPDPNICADFDHNKEFVKGKGYYRVHYRDWGILLSYWKVKEPPQGPGIEPNCLDVP